MNNPNQGIPLSGEPMVTEKVSPNPKREKNKEKQSVVQFNFSSDNFLTAYSLINIILNFLDSTGLYKDLDDIQATFYDLED